MKWLAWGATALLLSGCGVSVSGSAASPTVEVSVAASAIPGCADVGDISSAATAVVTAFSSNQDLASAAKSLVNVLSKTPVPDAAIADRDELAKQAQEIVDAGGHAAQTVQLAFVAALGKFNSTLLTACS